ncbi:unnamed protein product [Clavelina lepadiformis]|uniref:Uncharacterized protein n=1 Tax=Clavelina lepadiformis TaxID=159417 RepID=A0ABP0FF11_CLALP
MVFKHDQHSLGRLLLRGFSAAMNGIIGFLQIIQEVVIGIENVKYYVEYPFRYTKAGMTAVVGRIQILSTPLYKITESMYNIFSWFSFGCYTTTKYSVEKVKDLFSACTLLLIEIVNRLVKVVRLMFASHCVSNNLQRKENTTTLSNRAS